GRPGGGPAPPRRRRERHRAAGTRRCGCAARTRARTRRRRQGRLPVPARAAHARSSPWLRDRRAANPSYPVTHLRSDTAVRSLIDTLVGSCEETRELLSAHVEGELTGLRRLRVRLHLARSDLSSPVARSLRNTSDRLHEL